MKWTKVFYAAMCAAVVFTSCSDDDEKKGPIVEPFSKAGIYVLNEGSYNQNNAGLTVKYAESGEVVPDRFQVNGRGLGELGQDMIVYGSHIYIAVSGSEVIEVTDLTGVSVKQVKPAEGTIQPRYMAAHNGKVYITSFDGYVARLDTTSLTIEDKVQVGHNPENIVVVNNKLYVANSGGMGYATGDYDKTVSVIDIPSFTETKKIEVVFNPCNMVVDSEGDIYLVSMGDYTPAAPNTLQKIDTSTDEVSSISIANATQLAIANDKIYMIYSQYGQDKPTFYVYDAINETIITDAFIAEDIVDSPYKISADVVTGNVYITSSNYTTNGDVYEFNAAGSLIQSFETGMNPSKVIVIR